MASTTRLGMYQPIGTLKATATDGGTSSTFICSNADATTLVADSATVYRLYSPVLALIQDLNLTIVSKQVDVPSVGKTTVTFNQTLASATLTGQFLYKPEVVNYVTALNNQLQSMDDNWEAFSCTSSTRPGSPFEGMLIWETDTARLYQWDGSAWLYVSGQQRGWGLVGRTTRTSLGSTIAQGDPEHDPTFQVTFTPTATNGRFYRVFCSLNWDRVSGTLATSPYVKVNFRAAAGADITTSSTLISEFVQDVVEPASGDSIRGEYMFMWDGSPVPSGGAQVTIGLTFSVVSPASTSVRIDSSFAHIDVFDIGPWSIF